MVVNVNGCANITKLPVIVNGHVSHFRHLCFCRKLLSMVLKYNWMFFCWGLLSVVLNNILLLLFCRKFAVHGPETHFTSDHD